MVTGASSGIGKACAEMLAEAGVDLVVVARDQARLEALAEELERRCRISVEVLVADLSERDEIRRAADRLSGDEGGAHTAPVDVLVNNAGFGRSGDFIDLDPNVETEVIDVNVVALHRLAHAAGGAMAARGRGWILNVSSVAGFTPAPKSATYAASKAFVTSFSEALHAELGPQGVVVTCLCPGLTRTEFHQRAGVGHHVSPDILWQSAEAVAEAGLSALAQGKAVVVPGAANKMIKKAVKAMPDRALRFVATKVNAANKK